jgi:2-oxoglutarate ferredoxin oxidoreductase subunit alpha
MGNVVGLGALLALTGHPLDTLAGLVRERFAAKGRKVVKLNLDCLRAGAEYVKKHDKGTCPCLLPVLGAAERRLVVSGSQALALGAIAGGVRFYAGYPMSPATPIMEFLSVHQKDMGLVVEQAEDEVSALNMVLGASYAGVRAMTATSGGGFSLMVEALGFAGMAELPCVVVIAQRPGPATGFPTRTEQADLLFSMSASQDEFPRFVFAPGGAEEAFHCMRRAFGLAERYQVPVLVLTDQFLSDSVVTVAGLDAGLESETGAYEDERWAAMPGDTYRRYEVTADGVSPLVRPGTRGQFVRCIGAEHDEQGNQTEDANARTRMHEKRMTKLVAMACAADGVECIPSERVETLVTAWGSTAGPVREAVERLRARGANVGMLRLSTLAPFPRERVRALSSKARRLVTVEQNSAGQLAALLGRELRMRPQEQVLRYDGRPFGGAELVERLGRLVG